MSNTYKIKINDQKVEIDGKTEDEYQIRTLGGKEQEVEFEKRDKGTKSKEKIKLEYRKKPKGKDWESWKSFESDVEWTGGWFINGMKFNDKQLESGVVLKEEVKPSLGMFKAPTLTFWGIIVVSFISLVALIWWWIASSNKEDKEEESL